MVANAHIDPVWLWNWQSGADEAVATFRSVADRCDEYQELVFTRGEAWAYRQVETLDPELFERVRELVKQGRWHITGGQFVQPDANLPTEMGWRRQLEHGRRYFAERFGVSPVVGYNVDSFGHPGSLPDILAAAGYVGYVFSRPRVDQLELPAQTFVWEGTGGARILACRIMPTYATQTDDLYGQISLAIEAANDGLGHALCFYGAGNHGGGPTKKNIEYILANARAWPGVELRFSTPEAFFEAVSSSRHLLPTHAGELQHTFPGCYSVMHDIKQRQYHNEHLLDQCERIIDRYAENDGVRRRLQRRLDEAWEDLVFTQFHDTLAGTSVLSAYESVRALQGRAQAIGEEIAFAVTRRWARRALEPLNEHQITIINPDPEPWEGLIATEPWLDFDSWGERWLSDVAGHEVDFQLVQPEAHQLTSRVLFGCRVEPGGSQRLLVRRDAPPESRRPPSDLGITADRISNGRVHADLGPGGIAQLRVDGRDVLGASGIGLHLRRDSTDTWTFFSDRFTEPVEAVFEGDGWVVEESGPLRARARLEGDLEDSRIRLTASVHRDDPRLYVRVDAWFNERFRLLQMPISLAANPARWTAGAPGGVVERAAGPTEWPVQGWSRVDLGDLHLAVVTGDCYSASLDGGIWQWTLLRSPKAAWGGGEPEVYAGRDEHTDQGRHGFELILWPARDLAEVALATAARQQAQPPVVFDRYEGLDRPPWGDVPPPAFRLEAVRRALRDGRLSHLADTEEALRRPFVPPEERP
jgi:alpha-mannosidase